MLIEAGMDEEFSAVQLLEEALRVIKSVDNETSMKVVKSSNKKEKKVLH
jgi:hypothetical protein